MSRNITAALAAAALLATTGMASARQKTHAYVQPNPYYYNYSGSYGPGNYYNQTYWNAIAPQPGIEYQSNPYRGSVWYGVAPY
jgi:hypothetical protein